MADSAIRSITLYPLTIPMRHMVTHAASRRRVAEPIVVSVELNSHVVGYGEALPRSYVTGETVESVTEAIRSVYVPVLLRLHPASFAYALEAADALPWSGADGRRVPAARAAVELALLDAYSRHFRRPMSEAAGWMGVSELGHHGSLGTVRHSGVLATAGLSGMKRMLRFWWWYGIRDFKIKVGTDGDDERLRWAARYLTRPLAAGRASLRVDANGAWTLSAAIDRLESWRDIRLAAVEQPLSPDAEQDLPALKRHARAILMYDESLTSIDDARRLLQLRVADGFNIRISKCGGLLASLRLAHFARKHDIVMQLGCMVGETSILAAAGRKFLELVPAVRFAEGSFGTWLLQRDVASRSVRFGYAGRVRPIGGYGWGIDVDPQRLADLTTGAPVHLVF